MELWQFLLILVAVGVLISYKLLNKKETDEFHKKDVSNIPTEAQKKECCKQ